MPGSNRDFIGAHSVVDVSNADSGVSIATLDAPLLQLGALTDERQNDRGTRNWRERTAAGTTIYAYLFNNYWHTNYKAYQQGPMKFRFVLRAHAGHDALALRRFSDEQDHPLLVFAADRGAQDEGPLQSRGRPGHAVVVARRGRRRGARRAPLQPVADAGDGHAAASRPGRPRVADVG